MTHLLCHWTKYHRKRKMRPISHEKKTNLGKSCVTITYLMVKFYKETDLSDVICEECSGSRVLTSKADSEKNNQY